MISLAILLCQLGSCQLGVVPSGARAAPGNGRLRSQVLVNTCAIREGAEQRIWSWLGNVRHTLYGSNTGAARWRQRRPEERRPVVGVLGEASIPPKASFSSPKEKYQKRPGTPILGGF